MKIKFFMRISVISCLMLTSTGLVASSSMEECTHGCFDNHMECRENAENSSILAHKHCVNELSACQMSCKGGKKMEAFHHLGSMEYSFRPILEDLI